MFFPIGTDRPLRSIPWVNGSLIAINILIFLFMGPKLEAASVLQPLSPSLHPFITYQFIHAGWQHLLGNMAFLYVFGNLVEDRMGHLAYLFFYLAGGVLAGLGHAFVEPSPVVGASGAVCAVTGAFLVLFPFTHVTIAFLFVFGSFEIASLFLILLQVGSDLLFQFLRASGVAYAAHLTGYIFGFLVSMALLGARLLPGESTDLLAILEHRRRRWQFVRLANQGYHAWEAPPQPNLPPSAGEARELSEQQRQLADLRSRIGSEMLAGQGGSAARLYLQLRNRDPQQILPRETQLEIANQLMLMGLHGEAAAAYEAFLGAYRDHSNTAAVRLILALICLRYLQQPQRAGELARIALPELREPEQIALARDILTQTGVTDGSPRPA